MPVDFIGQRELTDAGSIPRDNLSKSVAGMAHFAGTGPQGAYCQHCYFWEKEGNRVKPFCQKFRQMTGDKTKPVPGSTPACRYYQARARA